MHDDNPVPPSPWPVPIELYHSTQAAPDADGTIRRCVSATTLKAFRNDPRPFLAPRLTEKKRRAENGMALGSALHDYYLTPERYAVHDYDLDGPAREKLGGMIDAIDSAEPGTHGEQIRKLLRAKRGRSEWSAFWVHETGLVVKIRPDRLVSPVDGELIDFDLKSSHEATPEGFRREARRFGYYHATALRLSILRLLLPGWNFSARWGFVSSTFPHRTWCPSPDPVKLQRAAEENERTLQSFSRAWLDPSSWSPELEPWERIDGDIPEA